MRKKLKWILGGLVIVFALLQFTNPARTNPPVIHDITATNAPPQQIVTLLHNACYDCHSNQTKWPWYSHIAPVSWLVVSDVNGGRHHLNFSNWPTNADEIARLADRINEVLGYHEMPPTKYTIMHPKARLTAAQRKTLINWSNAEWNKWHTGSLY